MLNINIHLQAITLVSTYKNVFIYAIHVIVSTVKKDFLGLNISQSEI